MNSKLLLKIAKEKKFRGWKWEKDENNLKDFSWVLFFAGEEFNQELSQNQEKIKLIDFSETESKKGEWIEEKIREIYDDSENKKLIEEKIFPIIWFKNIEKIKSSSALEQSLLPVFDPQQNTKLFNEEVDLSNYILIATSSTRDMGQLSAPLTSRLGCVNVETAKPQQFFLDKHFTSILIGSFFLIFVLLLIIFWPIKEKTCQEKK